MEKIYLITDYKNFFGSKWKASPYRSGYNKELLKRLFYEKGYDLIVRQAVGLDLTSDNWNKKIVLYTSSEEPGLYYKGYLNDIIRALEIKGAKVLPASLFLQAHENKVFMESLRDVLVPHKFRTIKAISIGTLEEATQLLGKGNIQFPTVIKKAEGAMSKGVFLARSENEFLKICKKITSTLNFKRSLKEKLRIKKHLGYLPESQHQKKFIIQPFIPNLTCDWKVLVYGKRIFILQRNIKKNDFRASGSGFNYKPGSQSEFPVQFLDFVYEFYQSLNLPNLSLDFAYDGKNPYIIEFQAIYFGTSTQYKSKDYYELVNNKWEVKNNTFDQESIYVESIVEYLDNLKN